MIPLASVEVAPPPSAAGTRYPFVGFFARGDGATREIWLLDNGWVRMHPADGTFPILLPPHRVVEARHIAGSNGELLAAEDFI